MSEQGSAAPRKLLADRGVKIRIALGSGLVLGLGTWLAPSAAPTQLSAPQEHAAPLLEEQVQIRETVRPFVGVQDVAAQAREHSVAIVVPASPGMPGRNDYSEPAGGAPRVAGFGVYVSDTHVLTHSLALDGREAVALSLDGTRTTTGRVVSYEPPTGLVLLQSEPSGRAPAALASEPPPAGALAVAVGRSAESDRAVPVFVTGVGGDRYTIGTINGSILPGMPVFTLTGELFAIVGSDGRDVLAIPVRQAAERMIARASAGERRSSFGLGFQPIEGRLTEAFGDAGVVITDVLPGGPAHAGDVQTGDVLLAVGDVEIDSADTAARVLSSSGVGTATSLRVKRGARVSEITVVPALAYKTAALARASAESLSAPLASALLPAAVLDAAAISPSARVVSVNGRTLSSRAQVQRELRLARRIVPVLVREDSHQFFVAVEPTR